MNGFHQISYTTRTIGFAFLILAVGCGQALPIGGTLASTRSYQPRPRTASQVSLYLAGEALPACNVNRVGIAMYDDNRGHPGRMDYRTGSMPAALEGFRAYLAELGVDGAIDVVCPDRGTVGFATCQGTAYVCDPDASNSSGAAAMR